MATKEEDLDLKPVFEKGTHHASKIDSERPVRYAKKGLASEESFPAITFPELFIKAAKEKGDKPAIRVERPLVPFAQLPVVDGKPQIPPSKPLNQWKTWTYSEYLEDNKRFAKSLLSMNFEKYDGVSIFGFNSPEWIIALFGSMFIGARPAGIYPSDAPQQVQFKCDHSNSKVVVVDNQNSFNIVAGVAKELPLLETIVCWGEFNSGEVLNADGKKVQCLSWEEFMELGKDISDDILEEKYKVLKPTETCVMIYSSGTTGEPKGVMLSHDTLIFEGYAMIMNNHGRNFGKKKEEERLLSYLPICHIAAFLLDLIVPVVVSAFLPAWCTCYLARDYDLRAASLVNRMQAIEPTYLFGVPRIWEKLADVLTEKTAKSNGLIKWALKQGAEYTQSMNYNPARPSNVAPKKSFSYSMADFLVLSKVRSLMGLGKVKIAMTGAAPIQIDVLEKVGQLGVYVDELFGMSEAIVLGGIDQPFRRKWNSIGIAQPCQDVKLFKVDPNDINNKTEVPRSKDIFHPTEEEQGELCFRIRGGMTGYLANPRKGAAHVKEIEEKNAQTIDNEGYLHTGDKAAMSEEGFMRITGRYKELILGSNGENIAPVPIEAAVKTLCPFISNFVMIGEARKYNVALVTLKLEGATGAQPGTEKLLLSAFEKLPIQSKTIVEAMEVPVIIEEIKKRMEEVNNDGKVCISKACKIQKFLILPRDLSIASDELTATMKLRRPVVAERYAEAIELMYAPDQSEVYVQLPKELIPKYI